MHRTDFAGAAAVTAALFVVLVSPTRVNAQDQGELAFNNHCRTCHSIKPGDNRLGPSLGGVYGRKAGTSQGYRSYSQSMTSSGIVWDEATLDKFIANPEAVVPNNNMKPYKGVPDQAVRKEIVAYLKAGKEKA